MSDRPILFSAPMVRAILREIEAPGTGKTKTRRVLKLPTKGIYEHPKMGGWAACTVGGKGCYLDPDMTIPAPERACISHQTTGTTILPPYDPGDRLWVREAFRGDQGYDAYPPREWSHWPVHHEADEYGGVDNGRLRPGIHMPRWASRLTLHVTDVRVQRLQGISDADARAEGVESASEFRDLWDSLNAERAPWVSNPWVVAVTFRPLLENIDRVTA